MSFLTSMRPTLRALPLASTCPRAFSSTPVGRVAKMTVVGRLAATPELITTDSGRELVRYAVGTNHGTGDNRTTSWWRVASFAQEGPGRERLLGLNKGTLVYLEGEASMGKYERDGKIESSLNIVQSKLEVLKRNDPNPDEEQVIDEK